MGARLLQPGHQMRSASGAECRVRRAGEEGEQSASHGERVRGGRQAEEKKTAPCEHVVPSPALSTSAVK